MNQTPRPILFVSSPESGLLNPMLVIAGELARQGVPDLWFATDEHRRTEVEELAGKSPVNFVSLGELIPELSAVTWDDEIYQKVTQPSRWKAFKTVAVHTFDPALRVPKYLEVDAAVEKIKPALMVIDSISVFAVRVAITRNIPFVLSVPFMPINVLFASTSRGFPAPNSGLPLNMTFGQKIANQLFKIRTMGLLLNPKMFKMIVEFSKARKELGISPEANSMSAKTDKAEMILCHSVPGIDYPVPIPEKMHLLGAMIPPLPQAPEDAGLSAWLNDADSVVYMGFGTITRLTGEQVGALVDVARKLEGQHHVLWKLPKEQQHLLPPASELPSNLRIESWVPSQLDVLAHPHVKVFVNHGGGNGFHEGLYFGKPLVVRPLWVDCYDQAVRGEDNGTSLTLDHPETVDVDDVIDKITRVTTEKSFTERAQHFQKLQRDAGGRETAAELILGLPALT